MNMGILTTEQADRLVSRVNETADNQLTFDLRHGRSAGRADASRWAQQAASKADLLSIGEGIEYLAGSKDVVDFLTSTYAWQFGDVGTFVDLMSEKGVKNPEAFRSAYCSGFEKGAAELLEQVTDRI